MGQRLQTEIEILDAQQSKVRSLVVEDMRIKQRVQYQKQRDAFVSEVVLGQGFDSTEKSSVPVHADSLLCFVLSGLAECLRIPVRYFFTKKRSEACCCLHS